MNENSPLAVQAVVGGDQLDFTVVELGAKRATIMARSVYDHYLFKKGEPVEVIFPVPASNATRALAGAIASHRLTRTGEGDLDLVELVFDSLSEEEGAFFGQLIEAYPALAPKPVEAEQPEPPERTESPGIRELPAKLFFDVQHAPELSDEEREELVGSLDDGEKQLLASGDKGRLAQLVAVKLKFHYELGSFQKNYSPTAAYYNRIKTITDNNNKIVNEWLPSIDPSSVPEGMAEQFEKLKRDVVDLHAKQRENVKACEGLVQLEKEKEQDRAREMLRHSMEGPAFRPSKPEKKEEKAPFAAQVGGKRHNWLALQIAGTVLCVAIIVVVNFWDKIVAMTLPSETVAEMVAKELPLTKTAVQGAELYIYIDETKIDTGNKNLMVERGTKALRVARKYRFDGIRILMTSGRPLYATAYSKVRNVEPQLIPVLQLR